MRTFKYVEEYLLFLAGTIDINGKNVNTWGLFTFDPVVSLARYDVSVLESMASAVSSGLALTEKQGTLASKIILKYRRQLASKDLDVTPVENPQWKLPLRVMDYSKKLSINDDKLVLRFPFDTGLIEKVKAFAKESQGYCKWNKESKHWEIALTEYNISWIYTLATQYEFTIDSEVDRLMSLITEVEKTPLAIELTVDNNQLAIKNAPAQLIDFVESNIGKIDFSNIFKLVDYAPILGYTIDDNLASALIQEYGAPQYNLLSHRETKINPGVFYNNSNELERILDYADATERWPVVFYEPDLSEKFLKLLTELRPVSDIFINRQTKSGNIPLDIRYIYTVVPLKDVVIPLTISSAGMMFGGDKQAMLQNSQKIVYCTVDVYAKKKG